MKIIVFVEGNKLSDEKIKELSPIVNELIVHTRTY